MKYCPFCGTPAESDASAFCVRCGSRFPTVPASNSSLNGNSVYFAANTPNAAGNAANSVTDRQAQPAEKNFEADKLDNRKLIVAVSILGVLIVAMLVLLVTGVFSG